jgi:hypothetical protein
MPGTLYSARELALKFCRNVGNPPGQYFPLLVQVPLQELYIFIVDVLNGLCVEASVRHGSFEKCTGSKLL